MKPTGTPKEYSEVGEVTGTMTQRARGIREEIEDIIDQAIYQERTRIAEEIEKEKYEEGHEDVGGEAIADHAYDSKFEAFMFGYNQALSDAVKVVKGE